jgi:hypothetical protein
MKLVCTLDPRNYNYLSAVNMDSVYLPGTLESRTMKQPSLASSVRIDSLRSLVMLG